MYPRNPRTHVPTQPTHPRNPRTHVPTQPMHPRNPRNLADSMLDNGKRKLSHEITIL